MKSLIRNEEIGRYIIMFFIFICAFSLNLFGDDNGSNTKNFDLFSEEVILSDLIYNDTYSDRKSFIQIDAIQLGQGKMKDIYVNNISIPKENFQTYYSQLGFHSKLYRVIDKVSPFSKRVNLWIFYILNAALLSLVLIYILKWIESNYGKSVGIGVFFMLAFFAPDLNQFGRNLYWVGWTLFIPMCASIFTLNLIYHKKMIAKHQSLIWFAGAYIGCLIKFLFYYEFTPTIMVGMMIPYILFLFCNTDNKLRTILVACFWPTLGAIFAFLTSLVIKFVGIYRILGSGKAAWTLFMDPIENRVTGNTSIPVLLDSVNASVISVLKSYINRLALSIGEINFFYRDIIILFIVFSFIGYYVTRKKGNHSKKMSGLIITLWISIIAPFSWIILAKPHAYIHGNQCSIVWYLPFVIIGWTLVFYVSKLIIRNIMTKHEC